MGGDAEALTNRLIEVGVLEEDEDHLRLSERFKNVREEISENPDKEEINGIISEARTTFQLEATGEISSEELAFNALVVEQFLEEVTAEERLAIALSIARIESPTGFGDIPDSFKPLRGFEILPFASKHGSVVVVFWRDDCDPCDDVMEDLIRARQNLSVEFDVELAAVYGPNCAKYVRTEFDVVGAPTTLFFKNGDIETRLIGRANYHTICRELENLAV